MIKKFDTIMASIDIAINMAKISRERGYIRPVVNHSYILVPLLISRNIFDIEGGRHIGVELTQKEIPFTSNDCNMDDDNRFWLITGYIDRLI